MGFYIKGPCLNCPDRNASCHGKTEDGAWRCSRWDAIKDQNDDAYRALANEPTRASSALAAEWITVSVLGKIAVEMTDE